MPYDLAPIQSPSQEKLAVLCGFVTTTTAGTLSTVAGATDTPGFTVTKTAAEVGRYTVTLHNKALKLMYGHAVVQGAADAVAAAAKGQVSYIRAPAVAAATPLLYVQFATPSLAAGASADVEVEDAAVIRFFIVLGTGKC